MAHRLLLIPQDKHIGAAENKTCSYPSGQLKLLVVKTNRIRAVRYRLAAEGPPWTRDHELDFQTVAMPDPDCDIIRDLLIAEGAETVVEIGLAYASSALAIGEALIGKPQPSHIIIDPFQESAFANVGWGLLESAGLDSIARLIALPSSIALPQLVSDGVVADAAFVDGSHRFHEVFVDLYFLRKIVRPGGLIILDDNWAPSVHSAISYFEKNLGWVPVPDVFNSGTMMRGKRRGCAFRLPGEVTEPAFEEFQPFC